MQPLLEEESEKETVAAEQESEAEAVPVKEVAKLVAPHSSTMVPGTERTGAVWSTTVIL